MKWYNSLIKKIERNGNNIFLYDLDYLLNDKNFLKELSLKYDIYKYENDADFYKFKNKQNPKLIYSNKSIRRHSFKNLMSISLEDVFPNLDLTILKNTDVSYFQKIYDYCEEFKSHNFVVSPENTKRIIFQSIWGIDLGMLHNPTTNLKIALEYLIENKEWDFSIVSEISNNLDIDLIDFKKDENKFYSWVESLILDFISENFPKYDLSDNLIQYYLSKIDLKSEAISELITSEVLDRTPWLVKFKLETPSQELIERKLKSELLDLDRILDKIYEDNIIDLNDLDNIFKLSRKFFKVIYKLNLNSLSFEDYNLNYYYAEITSLFKSIVEEKVYEQLFDYSYKDKPYTVDRILDFINYNFKQEKIVLIVLDGMSYDEWFILKKYLTSFKIKELESFSILPSITSFSRTSIFTGKTPSRFLDNNNKIVYNAEEKGFKDYFMKRKVDERDILFGNVDLNNEIVKVKNEKIEFKYLKGYQTIGLICNLFDDESHSINVFGEYKSNLYKNIDSAIQSSNLINLLESLKEEGYKVILTSDHGNIYGKSNGIKSNKMLQFDTKSSRCLIFDNEFFANKIIEEYPNHCFKWNYNLLSNNLYLVFAVEGCFGNKTSITHGSFMPEECIVPVIILE